MFDVIVVGGRCAGSSVGMLLARKGYKVLIVDRATFPSDTISGHCIMHRGTVRLKRWGLLEDVIATNCPPIRNVTSNFGDFTLAGEVADVDDAPAGIAPRRYILDEMLLKAAERSGAEIRQGFNVDGLLKDDDGKVTGIYGHTQDGKKISESARIVIGADGKHSRVAKWVGAPSYHDVPSMTCWYMTYYSDFAIDGLELNWRKHRLVLSLPTNDGLTLHAVAWKNSQFHEFRSNVEQNFTDTLMQMPDIAERLPDARRETQFYGMADVPSFFRKPYGDGWALVGDAGHHKDPIPAHGIGDAFCDAELLTEAIDKSFTGTDAYETAMAHYESQRNARAIPDHEAACKRAALENWDMPDMLKLRSALKNNPIDTAHYFAVVARSAPAESFFNPANIQRIIQSTTQQAV